MKPNNKKQVIFLDRDGVINEYPGDRNYVKSWEEFRFIPGSIEAIARLKQKGYTVCIVSNQAGVAKQIYSRQELDQLTENMLAVLQKQGASVDGVYYCVHQDEDNCDCRKPKTGLLTQAVGESEVDFQNCFFIGDSIRDMQAARSFGCIGVLVLSGKEKLEEQESWELRPRYIFDDLKSAVNFICDRNG